ncbi:Mor transcription activator family protein [Pseudomonas putida]|uniref:Mor transcription activator family protein n=1 Tax=Pseudomonas putida TaxID=303 RepID=UPI00300F61B3
MSKRSVKIEASSLYESLTPGMRDVTSAIERALEENISPSSTPLELAMASALEICKMYGGTSIYVTRVSLLKKRVRDEHIYSDYSNGVPIKSLVKKYRIASPTIYDIIESYRSKTRLK